MVHIFKRRYIGTGTLRPTGLEDLFGQFYILDEGQALGRFITHYRARYFHQKQWDKYNYYPNEGAYEQISEKVAHMALVVDRSAIPDLPKVTFDDRYVTLPSDIMEVYKQAEEDMLIQLEAGNIVAANAAVATGKCRQIANGFVYDENKMARDLHDEKLEDLADLIDELSGETLLIAYEFERDRDRIMETFKCPCVTTGNARRDEERLEEFRRGRHRVICGSVASLSLGLDGLQEVCGHIAMYGVTWKFVDYTQLIDRIRRQGSAFKNVVIHRILARGTVDARVVRRLESTEADSIDFMGMLRDMRHR